MPNNFLNPDSINTPSTIFNQPGDVWGNNEAPATVPLNTYYRVPQPNSAPITPDFATPQILTIQGQTLAATPDDVASTTTIPQPAAPTAIPTTPVVAPYSIARGLSILDQYRSGFWTTSDAIETIAASMATATAMDPTPAELVDAWTNFQVFSYLPVQISPSQADFNALSTPSQRATWIRAQLANIGINVSSALNAPTTKISLTDMMTNALAPSTGTITAEPPPYANTLSSICVLAPETDIPQQTAADVFNSQA